MDPQDFEQNGLGSRAAHGNVGRRHRGVRAFQRTTGDHRFSLDT